MGKWKCKSSFICIETQNVCNKQNNNCYTNTPSFVWDTSDEDPEMCQNFTCHKDYVKCADGKLCLFNEYWCNNRNDCEDKSDEQNCSRECPGWTCDNGANWATCIQLNQVCDGFHHCHPRGVYEENEEFCQAYSCPEGMWKCADGVQCITEVNVCDGISRNNRDCKDGSDESPELCTRYQCSKDQIKCGDLLTCIHVRVHHFFLVES